MLIGNGRDLSHSDGKKPERRIWIGLEVGVGRRRRAAEHQPKEVGSGARKADIHDAESDNRPSRVCRVVDGAKLIEQLTETKSRDSFQEGRLVREMPVRGHSGDASMDRQLAAEECSTVVCIGYDVNKCPSAHDVMYGCGTTYNSAAVDVCTITTNGQKTVSPYRILKLGTHEGGERGVRLVYGYLPRPVAIKLDNRTPQVGKQLFTGTHHDITNLEGCSSVQRDIRFTTSR